MTKHTESFKSELARAPFVYREFKRKTKELKDAGFNRYSALAILAEIRAENGVKILNAHAAEYARLFLAEHPKYAGFFKLNHSKVDA